MLAKAKLLSKMGWLEQSESSYLFMEVKMVQLLWKMICQVFMKVTIYLLYNLAIHSWVFVKDENIYIHKKNLKRKLIAAVFLIVKK